MLQNHAVGTKVVRTHNGQSSIETIAKHIPRGTELRLQLEGYGRLQWNVLGEPLGGGEGYLRNFRDDETPESVQSQIDQRQAEFEARKAERDARIVSERLARQADAARYAEDRINHFVSQTGISRDVTIEDLDGFKLPGTGTTLYRIDTPQQTTIFTLAAGTDWDDTPEFSARYSVFSDSLGSGMGMQRDGTLVGLLSMIVK